jgi:hypothetical protein
MYFLHSKSQDTYLSGPIDFIAPALDNMDLYIEILFLPLPFSVTSILFGVGTLRGKNGEGKEEEEEDWMGE